MTSVSVYNPPQKKKEQVGKLDIMETLLNVFNLIVLSVLGKQTQETNQ